MKSSCISLWTLIKFKKESDSTFGEIYFVVSISSIALNVHPVIGPCTFVTKMTLKKCTWYCCFSRTQSIQTLFGHAVGKNVFVSHKRLETQIPSQLPTFFFFFQGFSFRSDLTSFISINHD